MIRFDLEYMILNVPPHKFDEKNRTYIQIGMCDDSGLFEFRFSRNEFPESGGKISSDF